MPNDGIHLCASTNWYCSPPGSKFTARSTVIASTTIEITSASHLDAARSDVGSRITTAAPTIGTAHSTVNHGNDVTTVAPPGSRR